MRIERRYYCHDRISGCGDDCSDQYHVSFVSFEDAEWTVFVFSADYPADDPRLDVSSEYGLAVTITEVLWDPPDSVVDEARDALERHLAEVAG